MYNVLDLFAGAGGLSNGFEQTGQFQVKVAIEKDLNARKTLNYNHQNIKFFSDIIQIDYNDANGELLPCFKDIDIVIGGPPCQGFSNANRQRNTLISGNNYLIKEYLRAVEEIDPLAIVMENVRTMESEKHKFFLSDNNREELDDLAILRKEETIEIGTKNVLTQDVLVFTDKMVSNEIDRIADVILPSNIFSKLNTLQNKMNISMSKAEEYIVNPNNKKFFNNLIDSWESQHKYYMSTKYQTLWNDTLKNDLTAFLNENSGMHNLIESLSPIIETQKVLRKYKEVLDHKIVHEPLFIEKNSLCINLQSYNVFDYVKTKLNHLGYELNHDQYIFNAAKYGVPQFRNRLILIGVKREKLSLNKVSTPAPLVDNEQDYFTIYDAIGDLDSIEPNINVKDDKIRKSMAPLRNNPLSLYLNAESDMIYNHVRTNSTKVALERFKKLKQGDNFHNLSKDLKSTYTDHTRTQNTVYKRLRYNKPSETVINVRKSMWIHPTNDRALSIREAARLQSFPDTYKFFGNKDSQYQQVGNAVPPLLARAIAESLLVSLGNKVNNPLRDLFDKISLNV